MNYKLTLLKDLPDYPKGTQFRYRVTPDFNLDGTRRRDPIQLMGLIKDNHMSSLFLIPEEIIDNPEWIKKEIDHSNSMDLKCPVCGETRGTIKVCGRVEGNPSDGFHNTADVYFEYDCGHELRKLYAGS